MKRRWLLGLALAGTIVLTAVALAVWESRDDGFVNLGCRIREPVHSATRTCLPHELPDPLPWALAAAGLAVASVAVYVHGRWDRRRNG